METIYFYRFLKIVCFAVLTACTSYLSLIVDKNWNKSSSQLSGGIFENASQMSPDKATTKKNVGKRLTEKVTYSQKYAWNQQNGSTLPPKRPKAKNNSGKKRIILSWTQMIGRQMPKYWKFGNGSLCNVDSCMFTFDKSLIKEADAVVFFRRNMNLLDLPPIRFSHQIYVFFWHESPPHTPNIYKIPKNFFNMTITYREDSDIQCPYNCFLKNDNKNMKKPKITEAYLDEVIRNKTKFSIWLSSNCRTTSKREIILKELETKIDLNVFGRCGRKYVARGNLEGNRIRDYKFYFAFENSICHDYITEKFFRIEHFTIPVVLKRDLYPNHFPKKSFIALDDFENLDGLVDYLHKVAKNATLYKEYLMWHLRFHVGNEECMKNKCFCQLCSDIQSKPRKTKIYEDISKFWYFTPKGENACELEYAYDWLKKSNKEAALEWRGWFADRDPKN